MKVIATIPARLGSHRLPRKLMLKIGDKTILQRTIEQIGKAQKLNEIYVCMTKNKEDDELYDYCEQFYDIKRIRGDQTNIISRILLAANYSQADYVINCDGEDCLIDPRLIDKAVEILELGYQSISFGHIGLGLGPVAFTREFLKAVYAEKKTDTDFQWGKLFEDHNKYSIDSQADYERMKELIEHAT